jgi:RNA polymerase sigma factor (sigma-70 family)
VNLNNFIEKNYKKWHNFAKIITSNKECEDLLHDVLVKLLIKYPEYTPEKYNDNFIFITLKNTFLTKISKNKIDTNSDVDELLELVVIEDEITIEDITNKDIIFQEKIDCISKTILSLNQFERKLYQLHYVYGLSQRKIAREIGVSHLSINSRINKIKEKIKENYDRK